MKTNSNFQLYQNRGNNSFKLFLLDTLLERIEIKKFLWISFNMEKSPILKAWYKIALNFFQKSMASKSVLQVITTHK